LNLIHVEKSQRIQAMDEVKRAIESAEVIPFTSVVLHLGMRDEAWNTRALENSMTAIEHLKAFAHPLGVKVLLENLVNDVTTPEHLMEILKVGHFDNVGICLDVGHANLFYGGVQLALEQCGSRVKQLHLHDNHGTRDEHLWPGSGTIDWKALAKSVAELPAETVGYLEIASELGETEPSVQQKSGEAFALLGQE
jgi:sugar phosphate isomerase/epimerase